MVDGPAAEIDLWPNGRLLRIRCGGLSIVETVCRYGDFTGIANTYHPNGSVAESLTFVGGILEGSSNPTIRLDTFCRVGCFMWENRSRPDRT